MKKLTKLQINAEKLLKNEELLTLKGGYDSLKCYTGKAYGAGATLYCGDCSYHHVVSTGSSYCP